MAAGTLVLRIATRCQRAARAARLAFVTDRFGVADDQGVVFVVEHGVGRKRGLEALPDGFIILATRQAAEAFKEPAGIGVHDKHRTIQGIQQDIVGGFGADAVDPQELLTEFRRRDVAEPRQPVRLLEPVTKRQKPLGFQIKITSRTDQRREVSGRQHPHRLDAFQIAAGLEGRNRAFDIGPGGILRQDGTNRDLKRGIPGPPVLRAIRNQQDVEDLPEKITVPGRTSCFFRV
ncbi:hypothetical protein CCP4SC76_8250002 [Gammaproteobacteria bacterium]